MDNLDETHDAPMAVQLAPSNDFSNVVRSLVQPAASTAAAAADTPAANVPSGSEKEPSLKRELPSEEGEGGEKAKRSREAMLPTRVTVADTVASNGRQLLMRVGQTDGQRAAVAAAAAVRRLCNGDDEACSSSMNRPRRQTTVPQRLLVQNSSIGAGKMRKQKTEGEKHHEKMYLRMQKLAQQAYRQWKCWNKVYEEDHDILKQVYNRDSEGAQQWDEQARAAGAIFEVDFIVDCTTRTMGDEKSPDYLLIKYTDYPLPCFQRFSRAHHDDVTVQEFSYFTRLLDMVELSLKKEMGSDEAFVALFPNRYSVWEEGVGEGGYVCSPRNLYVNKLKSIQYEWNVKCRQADLPYLLIADWTKEPEDDESLKNIDFITALVVSSEVKKLSDDYQLADSIKCGTDCRTCSHTDYVEKNERCCGIRSMHEVDEETGQMRFRQKPDAAAAKKRSLLIIECNEECGCVASKCKNREVQRGRPYYLVVFRCPGKGWTLRTLEEIPSFSFVSSYCGVVSQEAPIDGEIYNFNMSESLKMGSTLLPPMVISAAVSGNETRYLSHSCNPNLDVTMVMVGRAGSYFTVPRFSANQSIPAGDELHFNYFKDVVDPQPTNYFDICGCKADDCQWPHPFPQGGSERQEEDERERGVEQAAVDDGEVA